MPLKIGEQSLIIFCVDGLIYHGLKALVLNFFRAGSKRLDDHGLVSLCLCDRWIAKGNEHNGRLLSLLQLKVG